MAAFPLARALLCALLSTGALVCAPAPSAPTHTEMAAPSSASAPLAAPLAPDAPPKASKSAAPGAVPDAPTADSDAPPKRSGPCPKPSQQLRQVAADAYQQADHTAATEPHRAMAEAIRLRLDQLFKSGCGVGLDSKQLSSHIALLSERRELTADVSIAAGNLLVSYHTIETAGLALYAWRRGRMLTRINVAHAGPKLGARHIPLATKVFQPPRAQKPLLAVLSTLMAGPCGQLLHLRVLQPGGDPLAPEVLLDHEAGGHRCDGHEIVAWGDRLSFTHPGWHALFDAEMYRRYTLSFQYRHGTLIKRFGFSPGFTELVEDWLAADWSLAMQASAPANLTALKAEHAKLSPVAHVRHELALSAELFPSDSTSYRRLRVSCALGDAGAPPCPEWPKPVDFVLQRQGQRWLVANVGAGVGKLGIRPVE